MNDICLACRYIDRVCIDPVMTQRRAKEVLQASMAFYSAEMRLWNKMTLIPKKLGSGSER